MADRQQVEERIRRLIATETSPVLFSNLLFTPDGLFNQLAETEEERRALSQTPLFREALNRLWELEEMEITKKGQPATRPPVPTGLAPDISTIDH